MGEQKQLEDNPLLIITKNIIILLLQAEFVKLPINKLSLNVLVICILTQDKSEIRIWEKNFGNMVFAICLF